MCDVCLVLISRYQSLLWAATGEGRVHGRDRQQRNDYPFIQRAHSQHRRYNLGYGPEEVSSVPLSSRTDKAIRSAPVFHANSIPD
jgi:hypothetical protein